MKDDKLSAARDAMRVMMEKLVDTRDWNLIDFIKAELVEPHHATVVSPITIKDRVADEVLNLKQAGISRATVVMVEATTDVEFLIRILALNSCGAVAVPLNPSGKFRELENIKRTISLPLFQYSGSRVLPVSGAALKFASQKIQLPEDATMILMTTGTSGEPKAVVHKKSNLLARLLTGRSAIPVADRKVCLNLLPGSFAHGLIGVILQALVDSDRLVLAPIEGLASGGFSNVGKWIDAFDVTFLSGTPAHWAYITRTSMPPKGQTLRRVQMASAHATKELQERIRGWAKAPFFNCYGTTETASWISDRLIEGAVEINNVGTGVNWQTNFEIVNMGPDGVGEVIVRTSSLAHGYLTQASLMSEPFERYATGDLGKFNDRGELLLTGRVSRVINRGGMKVSPEEVEQEILALNMVDDAVVVGSSEASRGPTELDHIVGIIVPKKAKTGNEEASELVAVITDLLKKTLSDFKIPSQWIYWEEIPRHSNGKPDFAAIRIRLQQSPNATQE